ncbi:MAG TPA: endonuclease/exonuclease/phosphatase family protein [Roseiflexaceae bacterium]|nr:endonuclease/exonuclease/phosphatase family protein [Roseiflexaceae bacterium]
MGNARPIARRLALTATLRRKALAAALRRLALTTALLYCFATTALALVWTLQPTGPWWLVLTNLFAPVLFLPLMLVVPLALLTRSRTLAAAVTLPTVTFLALFGGLLLPKQPPTPPGTPLRVMSFNQLFSNPDTEGVIASLRDSQADIIALQELSPSVAQHVADLHEQYPYQALLPDPADSAGGLALLSRYPMTVQNSAGDFPYQIAALQVGAQTLTLINAHPNVPDIDLGRLGRLPLLLGYSTERRDRQIAQMLDLALRSHHPVILLGDLNAGEREPIYADLAAQMRDAFRETSAGFGFTFPNGLVDIRVPAPFPVVRLDYVWTRGPIAPVAAWVDCRNTSADHCALHAELRITPSDGATASTPRGIIPGR